MYRVLETPCGASAGARSTVHTFKVLQCEIQFLACDLRDVEYNEEPTFVISSWKLLTRLE